MPDLSLAELVLGITTALGAGGTAGATLRKPRPGTPEDHEQRITKLEGNDNECSDRLSKLETRMTATETTIAGAIGKLSESVDRQWKAVERLTESVDGLKETVIKLDVKDRLETELGRRRSRNEEE